MSLSSGEYRSWTFTDRSFLFAVAVSVLWHLFWFFSVTIVVSPPPARKPVKTEMVSLGPVLDDTIFKTLLETKPEYSQAFYRELSDFESATELPAQSVERHESGDVTSLPTGQKFTRTLRAAVGGDKASPELPGITPELGDTSYFELSGDISITRLLSRPQAHPADLAVPVEIEFEIDASGRVTTAAVAVSSGDTALDRRWEDHLRQWLFTPFPALGGSGPSKGKVVFRRGEDS